MKSMDESSLSTDGKRILSDLLNSPGFSSDIFAVGDNSAMVAEKNPDEVIRIACLDIGAYRQEDVKWRVEGEHVLLQGKRTGRMEKGVEGMKFSRAIPIPEGIDPKKITTRYDSLSGQFIIEGAKLQAVKRPAERKTSRAFYGESKMTLSFDLGNTMAEDLSFSAGSNYLNDGSGSAKIEI